jgi:Hpt domain
MAEELDLRRLAELQEQLGSGLPDIIATLIEELDRATTQIEAALAEGDMPACALAAHAARNSALMLDAAPLLGALREIETGARREAERPVRAGVEQMRLAWPALRLRLEAEAGRTG